MTDDLATRYEIACKLFITERVDFDDVADRLEITEDELRSWFGVRAFQDALQRARNQHASELSIKADAGADDAITLWRKTMNNPREQLGYRLAASKLLMDETSYSKAPPGAGSVVIEVHGDIPGPSPVVPPPPQLEAPPDES